MSDDSLGYEQRAGADLPQGLDRIELVEETGHHAIFMLDPSGEIITWSTPAESLYGYAPADVIGQTLDVLFADADGESPLDDVLGTAQHETVELEATHRRADGQTFHAAVILSPLWNDGFNGYAVVCSNTTDAYQYRRELERQNDRLKEFSDIIAHDLRNPLNVISARIELAREQEDATGQLEALEATTDRMHRLIEDLLGLARQGNFVDDPETIGLEAVVESAWKSVIAGGHEGELEVVDAPTISASPDRLCEALENLFRNAVEHGGDGVTVRVGRLEEGFYVEDDGVGIPLDKREDVFDHGVTTSEDGTGYGLSIVRTIVGSHGWNVELTESEAGGARFEFTGIEMDG